MNVFFSWWRMTKGQTLLISEKEGISWVVHWFRICLAMQGTWVPSLVKEERSHMPRSNHAHSSQLLSLSAATKTQPLFILHQTLPPKKNLEKGHSWQSLPTGGTDERPQMCRQVPTLDKTVPAHPSLNFQICTLDVGPENKSI